VASLYKYTPVNDILPNNDFEILYFLRKAMKLALLQCIKNSKVQILEVGWQYPKSINLQTVECAKKILKEELSTVHNKNIELLNVYVCDTFLPLFDNEGIKGRCP